MRPFLFALPQGRVPFNFNYPNFIIPQNRNIPLLPQNNNNNNNNNNNINNINPNVNNNINNNNNNINLDNNNINNINPNNVNNVNNNVNNNNRNPNRNNRHRNNRNNRNRNNNNNNNNEEEVLDRDPDVNNILKYGVKQENKYFHSQENLVGMLKNMSLYSRYLDEEQYNNSYQYQNRKNTIEIHSDKFNCNYYIPTRYYHENENLTNQNINNCCLKMFERYNINTLYQNKFANVFSFLLKSNKEQKTYKYVSYSNKINNYSRIQNKVPVSTKVYKYYSAQNLTNFIEVNSSNLHDDFASFRKGEEALMYKLFICKNFVGFKRIAIGDNISRTEDIGGEYYNHPNDALDKIRVLKYVNSCCVPNNLLHDENFIPQNYHETEDSIITMVDVQYYIPNIFNIYNININNNANDNIQHIKAIYSIFHVYNDKKGLYEYGPVKVKVYYNKINIDNNNNFIITEEDVDDDRYDEVINFNQHNRNYIIPYVIVTIYGNSYMYNHPFPILGNHVISIKNINHVYYNNMHISYQLLRCIPITNFDYYVTVEGTYYENNQEGIIGLNYGELEPIFQVQSPLPEKIKIKVDNNDLISLFDMSTYKVKSDNIHTNKFYIKDKYAIISNKLCYINYNHSEIFGDYIEIGSEEIERSIPLARLNTCVSCYKRMEISDQSILSAKNIIMKTAELEKWEPTIDINTATDYAIIAAYIVQKIHNKIKINANKLIEANKRIDEEINYQNKIINIKSKVKQCTNAVDKIINSKKTKSYVYKLDQSINENIINTVTRSQTWKIVNFFMIIHIYIMTLFYNIMRAFHNNKVLFDKNHNELYNKYYLLKIKNIKELNSMPKNVISAGIYKPLKNAVKNINKFNLFNCINGQIFDSIKLIKENIMVVFEKSWLYKIKFIWNYQPILLYIIGMYISIIFALPLLYYIIYEGYLTQFFIWASDLENAIKIVKFIGYSIYFTYLISRGTRIKKYQLIIFTIYNLVKGSSYHIYMSLLHNMFRISLIYVINLYILYKTFNRNHNIIFLYLLSLIPRIVSKDIYITSSCTPNNTLEMYNFLLILYKFSNDKKSLTKNEKEIVTKKYCKENLGKYKIIKMPKRNEFHCEFKPEEDQEPLSNICAQFNGEILSEIIPLKIHKCTLAECEAVYRQVQSSILYEEEIAKEYIEYSQKWIKDMVHDYFIQHPNEKNMSISEYFSKLGSKSKEYKDAFDEYNLGGKIDATYNMHPKSDEKIVINWENEKAKARNISAQKSVRKLLMGMVCEMGMKVLHEQPWAGPGENYINKAKKFLLWIKSIICPIAVCCDGSAFDSTQHKLFIKNIDCYFLNLIFQECTYLDKYFDLGDVKSVISQTDFTIYSKHFAFRIEGTQLSGRMNTCLSNTLRSATYVRFIIHKIELSLNMQLFFVHIFFEVTGDDQIIFMSRFLKDIYIEYAYKYVYYKEDVPIRHGLGQVCKIFDVYEYINGAEYLSCIILYDESTDRLLLTRKLDRFLQLIPYTFRNHFDNPIKFDIWKNILCYEVGYALTISCKNISLYYNIGKHMMKVAKKYNIRKLYKKSVIHKKTYTDLLKRIENIKKELSYKKFSDESDTRNYDDLFINYYFEKYNITEEDINNTIINFNKTGINDDVQTDIIDKLYNITPERYNKVFTKIYYQGDYVIRHNINNKYIYEVIPKTSMDYNPYMNF